MQRGSRGEGERKSYRPQSGVSARLAELCGAEELSRVLGTEQRLWDHADTRSVLRAAKRRSWLRNLEYRSES